MKTPPRNFFPAGGSPAADEAPGGGRHEGGRPAGGGQVGGGRLPAAGCGSCGSAAAASVHAGGTRAARSAVVSKAPPEVEAAARDLKADGDAVRRGDALSLLRPSSFDDGGGGGGTRWLADTGILTVPELTSCSAAAFSVERRRADEKAGMRS